MEHSPQPVGRQQLVQAIRDLQAGDTQVRVAIDGPCASGKSTLAQWLGRQLDCPVLRMDDFFLTPDLRTPERLAKPGENVDHERFSAQVLRPLCQGLPARFRPWDCHAGDFAPEQTVAPCPLFITEGVYSLRPDLRDFYQLKIWVQADWPTRRQRLLDRGGPGCLARFEQLWIPLEDAYFSAFQVRACCDYVVSGTSYEEAPRK